MFIRKHPILVWLAKGWLAGDGIRAELDWLEATVLPTDIPVLGICLGAQQIARVMGARVAPHPDGVVAPLALSVVRVRF